MWACCRRLGAFPQLRHSAVLTAQGVNHPHEHVQMPVTILALVQTKQPTNPGGLLA